MSINGCTSSGPGDFEVFNNFISSSIIFSVMTISGSNDSVTLPREGTSPGGSFVNTLVNCFWSIQAFSSSPNFKLDLLLLSSNNGAIPDFVFIRRRTYDQNDLGFDFAQWATFFSKFLVALRIIWDTLFLARVYARRASPASPRFFFAIQ